MAERSERESLSRPELLHRLELSRHELSHDLAELGDAFQFGKRIEDSYQRNILWWLAGSVFAGALISQVRFRVKSRRTKAKSGKDVKNAGTSLILGLLGLAGKQILRFYTADLRRTAIETAKEWLNNSFGAVKHPEDSENDRIRPGR